MIDEIIYQIRASQNDLLENLEKLKENSDKEILSSLEDIKLREQKILAEIEEVIGEIRLPD